MRVLVAHPRKLFSSALANGLVCMDVVDPDGIHSVVRPEEIAESVRRYLPRVTVLSASYEDPTAIEILRSIKEISDCGVVIVSGGLVSEEIKWAIPEGATGFVTLDSSIADVIDAVTKAAAGQVVIHGVDRKALSEEEATSSANRSGVAIPASMQSLTPREREVLNLLAQGFSNRQIAENLYLSEHTVRTHVQNLRGKLNVRSKFEAAVIAMQVSGAAAKPARAYRF